MEAASVSSDDNDPMPDPTTQRIGRARSGFRDENGGTHSSRSLMPSELELLLDATPPTAVIADGRRAVVEDKGSAARDVANVLTDVTDPIKDLGAAPLAEKRDVRGEGGGNA